MKLTILQEIIKDCRYTQVEFAEKIGVTPQLFNWMLKNPKRLKPDQIKDIAKVLKRSPRGLYSLIINN